MELLSIILTFVGYTSVLATLIYEKKKYLSEQSVKKYNIWVKLLNYLPVMVITPVLFFYIYEYNTLGSFQTMIISLPFAIRILGILLLIFSLYIYSDSILTMQKNWTIGLELRKGHELIKTHAYKYIRHPIYTAWFGIILSLGLIFSSFLYIIALIPVFAWYCYRAFLEEGFLAKNLSGYQGYLKTTKRFIPFIF